VGVGAAVPAGATVVDGAGKTLLPGLVDAHTHCRFGALEAAAAAGVTTEIDLMCPLDALAALRRVTGPIADLRSSGNPVTVPGGHGTEYGFPIPTLARVEDTEAFVAARIAEGSDLVKIILEDGTTWGHPKPSLDAEEVRRAVAAAHAGKRRAVVHVSSVAEARIAAAAGADGLAHAPLGPVDAALVQALAASHAFVIPTLTVLGNACSRAGAPAGCADLDATVRSLSAAGVPLLAGSDAPNPGTSHGETLHVELQRLAAAGLTPVQALVSATSAPAAAFGLDDRGRIAVGKRADLLLVRGDPTLDLAATRAIEAVWTHGLPVPLSRSAAGGGGPVSDFDDGTLGAAFGSAWTASDDRMVGGTSTATVSAVDGHLAVDGEVRSGPGLWAGAWFEPGRVDLSGPGASIRFRVRGDPGAYAVLLFPRAQRFGQAQPFQVTAEWTSVTLPFAAFGTSGADLRGVFVGSKRVGRFHLELDDVAIGPP
jgi:imidazolonepropionase-like amidohydrolase